MVEVIPTQEPGLHEVLHMITLDIFTAAPPTRRFPEGESNGLSRLFAAAVVSRQFCETLLEQPEAALKDGYLGQTFPVTDAEKQLLQSIHAESLTDLARKVNRALKAG
jgi:hypothetical protein